MHLKGVVGNVEILYHCFFCEMALALDVAERCAEIVKDHEDRVIDARDMHNAMHARFELMQKTLIGYGLGVEEIKLRVARARGKASANGNGASQSETIEQGA